MAKKPVSSDLKTKTKKTTPHSEGVDGGGDSGLYASFTTSKGNTFYAKDYGYKAWPIGRRKS